MGIENAKNLGKVLLGMTSENMYTAADYDKAILSLGKKQIDLTNKISAMQEKRKEVAAVTKSLQICKTHKPVWMQYVELPMSQKSAFYSGIVRNCRLKVVQQRIWEKKELTNPLIWIKRLDLLSNLKGKLKKRKNNYARQILKRKRPNRSRRRF